MTDIKVKPLSPYTLLNRWLYDGSRSTQVPEDVLKDKSVSQLYLLYFFQASPFILYISKHFNNYGLFQMDREDVFKFIKECVLLTGYRPPFVQRLKPPKSKFVDCLRLKYPFLKDEELWMLVDIIDKSDEKDNIYEMFGLYTPKKKKLTKVEQKKLQEESHIQKTAGISGDELLGNFES